VVAGRANLRSTGRRVEGALLRLVLRLDGRYGRARWKSSERTLRRMLLEDEGLFAGLDVVRTALRRLHRRGIIFQQSALSGATLPDGTEVRAGCRVIWVLRSERERRKLRALLPSRVTRIDRLASERLARLLDHEGQPVAPLATMPRSQSRDDLRRKIAAELERARKAGLFEAERPK
jgi:hypothetical protein